MDERVAVLGDGHPLSTFSTESRPQKGPLLDQLERESIGKGQARPCGRGEFREGEAVQRSWSRWLDGRVVVRKDLLPGQIQAVRPAPIQTLSNGTASQNYSQVSSERAHWHNDFRVRRDPGTIPRGVANRQRRRSLLNTQKASARQLSRDAVSRMCHQSDKAFMRCAVELAAGLINDFVGICCTTEGA